MGKVILICGKICSGKSYYSNELKDKLNAVIISPDEATYELLNNEQGEFYDIFSERLIKYLTRKVGEIAQAGANVIFERGLWSKKERQEVREHYKNLGIECEIHYVCVDDKTWRQNIEERNKRVLEGNGGSDFYLDEGLMKKLESLWEEPTEDEYDVIYKVNRTVKHEMKLNNGPFNSIKNGSKIIELRLNDEKRQLLKEKDLIEFTNRETFEKLLVEIEKLHHFSSFDELYKNFDKELLGYKKDETADPKDMEKYYSKEEQEKYGVLGIEIKKI